MGLLNKTNYFKPSEKERYLEYHSNYDLVKFYPTKILSDNGFIKVSFENLKYHVVFPCDKFNRPVLSNSFISLKVPGFKVQLNLGKRKSASYNWGDPLPDRYEIEDVKVNGKSKTEYIDQWYPWVRYDLDSMIERLEFIMKEEMKKK